ncbi:membrane protein insertion efficiency factor YidD [Leptospira sp. WS60.C2]
MNRLFLLLITLYKKLLSPLLPPACRFTPSCSEYAKQAFETFPWYQALVLSIVRISKCHPYHEGGHDPLPKSYNKS